MIKNAIDTIRNTPNPTQGQITAAWDYYWKQWNVNQTKNPNT